MAILFRPTKQLESQIDQYLDSVSQGGIVFKQGVKDYIEKNTANFIERITTIKNLEHKADDLRRAIENRLYSQTLIPEHRGDVLGLLESTDNVIDAMKETLDQFEIENPYIPEKLETDFIELSEASVSSTEFLVNAARAFFKDLKSVNNHLHKIYFYEKEADRIGDQIKRKAFKMDIDLSLKFHLRYFASHIQQVSDKAESVADRLAIYTIKRTI
jgi:predicted phosphate transport protein (TIGR00153 family)